MYRSPGRRSEASGRILLHAQQRRELISAGRRLSRQAPEFECRARAVPWSGRFGPGRLAVAVMRVDERANTLRRVPTRVGRELVEVRLVYAARPLPGGCQPLVLRVDDRCDMVSSHDEQVGLQASHAVAAFPSMQ
jgi:hypothetical protein